MHTTVVGPFELTWTDGGTQPAAESAWLPAVVPGGVHESLLAAGRIEHPYFGENENTVRWVEDKTWWYRTQFPGPSKVDAHERLRLVLPSVDTVADIWLNGTLLGRHINAFRPADYDVTRLVGAANELLVQISPPLQDLTPPVGAQLTVDLMKAFFASQLPAGEHEDAETEPPPGVLSANLALTRRRKPTFSWGWDFGPRVPSIGILEPAELRRDATAAVSGHHLRALHVDIERLTAQLAVDVEVDAFAANGPLSVRVTLTAPDAATTEVSLPLPPGTSRRASAVLPLHDVQLWWTHDLGAPALYDVTISLLDSTGVEIDVVQDRIGIRTLELDRSVDDIQPGRLFRFVLNGVPTYSRGANWVPPSMLRGSVTAAAVRQLVETAQRGQMTMLRVWGGGAYEQDAFYDACDEFGLLVWQDFMFACIDYPSEEPALQDEVAREADFQVRRLRNHPSLALWCGNNEVHGIHRAVYDTVEPNDWGWHFFHGLLPDAVSRNSPGAIYWPGSPWADSDPRGANGIHDGDRHAWEVWHGMDLGAGGPTDFASKGEAVHFHRYAHDQGRFISEFGIHASPERGTLERWNPAGSLALGSSAFDSRNKDVPKDKGNDMMSVETGLPRNLQEFINFSMACQAEGLKFGVEHYRRRQPHNSGTLVWQLNDVWPGFSWSVIDFDLVPKASFYFLQRAYRPVIASFKATPGRLELWLTNSGRETLDVDLIVEVATFSGAQVLQDKVTVSSDPASSVVVWTSETPQTTDRFGWVSSPSGILEPNRIFFGPLKELPLTGTVDVHATRLSPSTATLDLTSHGYSYFAHVPTPTPGMAFDANYLDLRDGDRRTISVTGLPEDLDLATLEVATYIRS
jgi:beta-mannosidase